MKKETSNKLFILILAMITAVVVAVMLGLMNVNGSFSFIIGAIVGFSLYIIFLRKQSPPRKKKGLKPVSDKREAFYKSRGLTDEDIRFFRDTMNKAKAEIIQVETNMTGTGKLKAIANRNNTLHLMKVMFKDIVNEPERLHEVDQFLYVHLPSLADLTNKYVSINQHQAKNKETYDILEKSANTIDKMCQRISQDYIDFRSTDISELANEVELAKTRLNRYGSDIEDDEI